LSQFESQFEEDLYTARLDTLQKIAALGQQAYPNSFAFTHTLSPQADDIPALLPLGLDADGDPKSAEALEAEHLTAAVAGRIVAIRLQGKAGFATLQQNGARLQIYVRKDDVGDPAFDLYKLLDLGDHIGVRGTLMRTRTGELTLKAGAISLPGDEFEDADNTLAVRAAPLTFLTKALLPLPDKYSGLGDIELRYRRRYLDLFTDTGDAAELPTQEGTADSSSKGHGFSRAITDPSEQGASAPEGISPTQTRLPARTVFLKRAAILRSIRNFFDTRGYLEVETPMLHTVAGGAAARPFTTHHNALDIPLSLRIAPELYLKRLVVGGLDRVYEINRNFRNEGVSTSHNPEFTMLEFYQAYANYHDLMDLTESLIKFVALEVNGTLITNFFTQETLRTSKPRPIDLSVWRRLSLRQAIIDFWPTDICAAPTWELLTTGDLLEFLRIAEKEAGRQRDIVSVPEAETKELFSTTQIDFVLNRLELNRGQFEICVSALERGLARGKVLADLFEFVAEVNLDDPTIIYDFPLAVSPLSKVKPDEPDWVERFEFYIGGFEVGNAFSELNDPVDQRNRFAAQVDDKDPESMAEIDEDYVRALGYGLPPTAGEGIGIDRLTMILTGSRSIRDVILFPLMRPPKPTPDQELAEPHGESAE
jgi:lysyl-tRNA synthetase class 2